MSYARSRVLSSFLNGGKTYQALASWYTKQSSSVTTFQSFIFPKFQMTSKGQSLLTDHFNVKKRISIDRNFKTPKTNHQRDSNNATPKGKCQRDDSINKTPKRKAESSTVNQVLKKPKVERKNLSRKKNSLAFKNEILNTLLAALPQKETLREIETLPGVTKAESKVPAFEKFYDLSQSKVQSLALPYKYKVLSAMFVSMDRAVSMLYNRKEMCTFYKIQKAVQQMTRRDFDMSRLAQIAKVYPESYNFTQEKSTGLMCENGENGPYYLVISPVMPPNENKLTSALLIERKNQFQKRLLDMAKDHHQAFLHSINPLLTIDSEELIHWHREFNVDQIPDVPLAQLPQPPHIPKYSTAKEVFEKARGMFGKKFDTVLENASKKFSQPSVAATERKPETNPALKGIPQALIDKIRAKEAKKLQALLTMPPEECLKRAIQAKLPEIARIIKSYFTIEKKKTILLEKVIAKISYSLTTSLSYAQIDEHIKRLGELVPEWIVLLVVSKESYVKIEKDLDLNIVLAKLGAKV